METKLLNTKHDIKIAIDIIKKGGLVAFPTETVYGLGADAFDRDAAKKAYAAKGRPSDNPLIVHIAQLEDLKKLTPICEAEDDESKLIFERVNKLARAFWPGPLTMVVPKKEEVPKETTGGLDTVAVRMPKDDATLAFIRLSGTAISGPSANLSGRPSPTTWKHVYEDLHGKIDAVICGDDCSVGIESTVIDVKTLTILRPGFITPEMISAVTGEAVGYDKTLFEKPGEDPNFKPMAPGQKYKHYAPKTPMYLVDGDINGCKKKFEEEGKKVVLVDASAENFFKDLRDADEKNADLILAPVLDEENSLNFSIMNRMLKACGYNIIKA